MKLGIGGGIGPLRAGISTRGAGVGFGPLKATTGWAVGSRSSLRTGSLFWWFVIMVRLTLISFFFVWPYGLATLGMRHLGFEDSSAWNKTLAWTAESLWLLLLVGGLALIVFGTPAGRRRAAVERRRSRDYPSEK